MIQNPSAATLFGMTKSFKNENPSMTIRIIDLDSTAEDDSCAETILFELARSQDISDRERLQVIYRNGIRYEPRFMRSTMPNATKDDLQLPSSTDRYQLLLPESKLINDLKFISMDEEQLADNEIEVKVKAYSLNFRDLFSVLKPTPAYEHKMPIGIDFSGVVTKVGKLVPPEKIQVGDRVCAMDAEEKHRANLPSYIKIEANILFPIPSYITYVEASTLPTIFSTSIYSLIHLAKLKQGETVLIHTGSGGVGLSAIHVAKHLGANIITTAGNPRKRAYLRSLGIEHVFHSRNTSFREDIMKVTNGHGVEIVLNSLTGPGFKEATLDVCAQNARFVEIGKLGVWTAEDVQTRRPDVDYKIVNMSDIDEALWETLREAVAKHIGEGHECHIPYVQFDAMRIRQALQYFQKAKHIGKVVVTMPEVRTDEGQWKTYAPLFNDYSTYLITGGLGGIGFEVCKWMLGKGATDVVLIGRNAPKPEVAKEVEIRNTCGKGYNVLIKLCDVGNYEQCKASIDEIRQIVGNKRIRGIQHCAGVLHDNLYPNQTWESFETALNPKVKGTWNLHKLTKEMPLEHFVFYSSITALAGSPGQANYAAAMLQTVSWTHLLTIDILLDYLPLPSIGDSGLKLAARRMQMYPGFFQ